ncbi:MAG: hypothetical protein CBE14_002470 [Rickettsiales bacterium TMED254]|nr:MAG: hypothetical protein CBE14_002470 [Rickettsiales bacterium TMED254]|tara:strand:- start:105 stop:1163 length:1059 start_codon:yes stop_codon:yes gene_type:complete
MLTLEQFKNKKINEAVTSADRTPQNVTGRDGKVRVRMVPTTKKSDTSEVYARPKGKVTVLKKGDPKIKAIQTVQKRKAKAFKDLAKKEMGEEVELDEMKEPFVVVDTADGNKVVATASDEKGAKSSIASAELPPMKIKDKKTLKVMKSKKKQMIGQPFKEEVKMGRPIKGTISKVGVPAAGPKPGEPGSVVKGVRIGRPIKGKISKKGVPAAAFRAEVTNPHDDEGANHIIMQLRKSVSLRGMRPVEFKDGKKVKVSSADAQKFLTKYNKSKPMDKEKMQAMAMKSHDGFKKALGESVQEDRMAGKYKKGQTIVRGQWPNPDKWAEEYIMPNADKKGVRIYSNGPAFVIEKL